MNREDYEADLKRRQEEHLRNIQTTWQPYTTSIDNWKPCMHEACTECHGTGIKQNGSPCIHGISCPCPKCSAWC